MKDTYYFQHDYNARNDPKLQSVLIELGVEGIGLYWCIIEQLYEQGGKLPLHYCKSIAFALHVHFDVVQKLVNDYGLFRNDGENMWSESVFNRLDKRNKISDKRKHAAIKRWRKISENKVDNQSDEEKETEESNANAVQVQCKCNANAGHKGKERKGNNIISTNVDTSTSVDTHEKKKEFSIDYSRLKELWKENCGSFPQPRSLAQEDKRKIRRRFGEMMNGDDVDGVYKRINAIFHAIGDSEFCKNGKWCTFRWVFENERNWRKVEDGNYSDRKYSGNKKANDEW